MRTVQKSRIMQRPTKFVFASLGAVDRIEPGLVQNSATHPVRSTGYPSHANAGWGPDRLFPIGSGMIAIPWKPLVNTTDARRCCMEPMAKALNLPW